MLCFLFQEIKKIKTMETLLFMAIKPDQVENFNIGFYQDDENLFDLAKLSMLHKLINSFDDYLAYVKVVYNAKFIGKHDHEVTPNLQGKATFKVNKIKIIAIIKLSEFSKLDCIIEKIFMYNDKINDFPLDLIDQLCLEKITSRICRTP